MENKLDISIIICVNQHFEADFLWKVGLKILNSGIILKTFTHSLPVSAVGTIGDGGATSSGITQTSSTFSNTGIALAGVGVGPMLLSVSTGRGSGSCEADDWLIDSEGGSGSCEASDWLIDSSRAACSSLSYSLSSTDLRI